MPVASGLRRGCQWLAPPRRRGIKVLGGGAYIYIMGDRDDESTGSRADGGGGGAGNTVSTLGAWYAEIPITNVPSERAFAIMRSCEGHLRHSLTEDSMNEEVSARCPGVMTGYWMGCYRGRPSSLAGRLPLTLAL